jgi:hypothetical protein
VAIPLVPSDPWLSSVMNTDREKCSTHTDPYRDT